MKTGFGLGGLILACACFSGQAYAKEITDHYNIKQMTVDVGDGWEAVISMKTAFALDTIVGEPKVMCAGTWTFEYAINPNVGRYDADNLPLSVIDDITLYDVDIAFDAGSLGVGTEHFDSRGQVGARVQCDLGVFYKAGSPKPSFNVPSSPSWDETFFYNIDGRFDYLSHFNEGVAKEHMLFLKEHGRKHSWEDSGNWVMNASVNLWPIRQHVAAIERAEKAKLWKEKNDELEAERAALRAEAAVKRQAAKERAEAAAAAIATKGDLSDDVFDDFFADDEEAKPEEVEVEVAEVNPSLKRWVARLRTEFDAADRIFEEAKTSSYRFARHTRDKRNGMADVYCAPKGGVEGVDAVGNYMIAYSKCLGDIKPIPRAYVLADTASFHVKHDFGLNLTQFRDASPIGIMIGEYDEDLDRTNLLLSNGEYKNLARYLGGNLDGGDNFIEMAYSHISERMAFGLHFKDRPIVEVDKSGNVLREIDITDIPLDSYAERRSFDGLAYGLKDELIIYWQAYGEFIPGWNYSNFRTVFDKFGNIISTINLSLRSDRAKSRDEEVTPDEWDHAYIRAKLGTKNSRYMDVSKTHEEGITLERGGREQFADLSSLDLCEMEPAECGKITTKNFRYRVNPATDEILMIRNIGTNNHYWASHSPDIYIHILKPVY